MCWWPCFRKVVQATLRQTDAAARLVGNEFAAVVPDVVAQGAATVGAKLVKALNTPLQLQDATVKISASVGIALHTRPGGLAERLIAKADEAMYEAKLAGKWCYVMVAPL